MQTNKETKTTVGYTKGEWKIKISERLEPDTATYSDEYRLQGVLIKPEEQEANAKLISAAPDLLENLIRIIDRIEENDLQTIFPSAYERAKQAIKKATE